MLASSIFSLFSFDSLLALADTGHSGEGLELSVYNSVKLHLNRRTDKHRGHQSRIYETAGKERKGKEADLYSAYCQYLDH